MRVESIVLPVMRQVMKHERLADRLFGLASQPLIALVMVVVIATGCGSGEPPPGLAVVAAPTAAPTATLMPAPPPTATVADTTAEPTAVAIVEPVRTRIEYGSESDQFGWLQLPDESTPQGGFPVVVLIHGGFWRQQFGASLMEDLATDLANRGYASWNIEYRRVGGAGGWPATGDDVAAAIDYLSAIAADQPLDLDRVVSVGHSAGGHLGLWALGQETEVQLRGSVGLGAVVDLVYFREAQALLGGTLDEVPQVYELAAPVLDPDRVALIQGGADAIVPQASLQVAVDALVSIVVIDGDGHFDLIDPNSDSWAAALVAVTEFLVVEL
jgi:acetyl esterase/lipase